MTEPLYLLPIPEACRIKHEIGRREHRQAEGAPFVGDPLIEAYAECIDLLNYLEEAIRQGEECAAMRGQAERLTHEMRAYLRGARQAPAY